MVHVLVPILVLVVFTLVVVGFAIFAWQLFRGSGDLSQRRTERLGAGLGLFVVCLAWQQIDAGGPILLVFAWGWIAVIPLGLWFFIRGLRCKPTISTWQGSQYFGLALLAAALAWQQGTAPLNFGRTLGVVVAENGEAQFEIKRAGFVGYTLLTTAREFKYPFHLSDRPRQVFWMRNSEAI